jgi:glycosyltransferase involved in cell wall biosynthesis
MKVTLVNHSDTLGGASVVTYRLLEALQRQGVDARLLVVKKAGDNPSVIQVGTDFSRRATFYAESLTNLIGSRSRANLFKVDSATFGHDLSRHPAIVDADVVVLNWCNQGMLSLHGIDRINKPLVWTMHDMWAATGVCHHTGYCEGYKKQCGNCPLINLANRHDLSHTTWQRKHKLYTKRNITFVAVSNWLAARCRESTLLRDADIKVIPNAFPVEQYSLEPKYSRAQLGLPGDERCRLIVMGAARLDDPIKGLPIAVKALNMLAGDKASVHTCAVFFGDIRQPQILDELKLQHVYLGRIADAEKLASLYAHATAVISTSHYETLPGTLIEGQAAGCFPVAFDRGGQRDIISAPELGYLAEYPSAHSIADGLIHALTTPIDREALHRSVIDKFSASTIAASYINLFQHL